MKILQVHNEYMTGVGGEDAVLETERELLRSHGHEVEQMVFKRERMQNLNRLELARLGMNTIWSRSSYKDALEAVRRFRPDVCHLHNTFPAISPSVCWAFKSENIPVVQTLHNFRLACANALLLRNDEACQLCIDHGPFPALLFRCYKSGLFSTGAVVAMQAVNRWIGTFRNKVDAYIALTQFQKSILVRAGIPEGLIHIKPNCVIVGKNVDSARARHSVFFYAGEISRAKGTDILLEAWSQLEPNRYRLALGGSGRNEAELRAKYKALASVDWLGWLPRNRVLELMSLSRFFVLPTRAYEGQPMTMLEAFGVGTPVIAPSHGAFPALIRNGENGLLFIPSNSLSLADALRAAMRVSDDQWRQWSNSVRSSYEREFSAAANYETLMSIYRCVCK
jgi:glycosyltransferase involved in cell wall biosynthesis